MRQQISTMKIIITTATILFLFTNLDHSLGANIPEYLLECYTNRTLLERDYRLPSTLTSLVDVIRKLELTTPDMRTLATSIVFTFRVDGITYDPTVTASDLVSPYGIKGYQRYKHSLLYRNFFPENVATIDLNLISSVEKCGLHFMLSDSIEFHQRGDEGTVCSRLSSLRRVRRGFGANSTYAKDENVENSGLYATQQDHMLTNTSFPPVETTQQDLKSRNITQISGVDRKPITVGGNDNIVNATGNRNLTKESKSSESPKNDEQIPFPLNISLNVPITLENNMNEKVKVSSKSAKLINAKATTTVTISNCPVENGVIYTKYGAVSGANLFGGIVTGLQAMTDIKFSDIAPLYSNANTSGFTMDNRWAATLAGDLAEVVSLQGPKATSSSLVVGATGGWNDTMVPHWYFIQKTENTQMTDAEIRGSLDGLIIATNIESWRSQRPNLRLSQLLERYYSERGVFDTKYRACTRRDNYAALTTEPEMTNQVQSFAYTLYTTAETTTLTVDAVKQFSTSAIASLNSYVPSFESISCTTQTTTSTTNASVVTEVELYIVTDRSWTFKDIHRLIISVAEMADLSRVRGSNVTVMTGNTLQTIVNGSMSYTEFFQYFNKTAYDRVGDTGFDLPNLLENYIRTYFQSKFDTWKQLRSAGGPSPVILFMPYNDISISDSDLSAAQEAMSSYWDNMPDLTFLYLLRSGSDRVTSLVASDEDIITYTINTGSTDTIDLSTLSTRLKRVHKRITNSICSYGTGTQSYTSDEFIDYVQLDYISYYKVSSKYLFGVNSATIRVRDIRYGTVTVCYSRKYQYPDSVMQASSNTDITCLTGQTSNDIALSLPCNGYEKISYCPPLYISIQGRTSTGSECTFAACKDVTDIQVKISHEGLTCGVGQIIGNYILVAVALVTAARSVFYS